MEIKPLVVAGMARITSRRQIFLDLALHRRVPVVLDRVVRAAGPARATPSREGKAPLAIRPRGPRAASTRSPPTCSRRARARRGSCGPPPRSRATWRWPARRDAACRAIRTPRARAAATSRACRGGVPRDRSERCERRRPAPPNLPSARRAAADFEKGGRSNIARVARARSPPAPRPRGVQVVVPALPALLADAAGQVRRDGAPLLRAELGDELDDLVVLLRLPGALDRGLHSFFGLRRVDGRRARAARPPRGPPRVINRFKCARRRGRRRW